jgi:polyhydroxyalkanoate synthase
MPERAEDWYTSSSEVEGSWWKDWDAWLSMRSGEMKKAIVPGKRKAFPVIEDAPGSYVKVRL